MANSYITIYIFANQLDYLKTEQQIEFSWDI